MNVGTFGQVLECWDRETKEMVAIKVVRSIKKYREAAMIEIDVLQLLGKYDRNGTRWVQLSEHDYVIYLVGFEVKFVSIVKWLYSLQLCSNTELVWLS